MRIFSYARAYRVLALFVAASFLQGCGFFSSESSEDASSSGQGMEISVKFQGVHRCSRISPEIVVANAPTGTTVYDVRLIEANGVEEEFFGGGSWSEDGSGIIPEGALTTHYRGPCPPRGEKRKYVYVVSAREGKNPQPLAVRVQSMEIE